MIRLHKGDAPAVLTANHGAWTAELLALIDAESGARARSENLPAFRLPGRGVF